jgi:hypothetical protein
MLNELSTNNRAGVEEKMKTMRGDTAQVKNSLYSDAANIPVET